MPPGAIGGRLALDRTRVRRSRSENSSLLRKSSALTLCILVAAVAPADASETLWQPRLRAVVEADHGGTYSALEAFIPLLQGPDATFFIDLRLGHDFSDGAGQDIGLGFRRVVNPDLIVGGYGYLDVRRAGGHHFAGATLGVEAISSRFDGHLNLHIPISDDRTTTAGAGSSLSFVGNQLIEQVARLEPRDYAMWGIEGEVGYQAPLDLLPAAHALRLSFGGYHFADPDGAAPDLTGAKSGFEYTIGDLFGTSGASLVLAGEVRHDNRNDTNFAGSVRLNIPLGWDGGPSQSDAEQQPVHPLGEALRKRANERVRDIGLPVRRQTTDLSFSRVAINAETDAAFGAFFFADGDNTLGLGTFDDPTTLDDAVAGAGADGYVVALGGAGNITTDGAALAAGQTVIGGGQTVQALLEDGTVADFNIGGTDGTVEGTNLTQPVISLADNNTLTGFSITDGGTGVLGDGISGLTVENVSISDASSDGLRLANSTGAILLTELAVAGSGDRGIAIEGSSADIDITGGSLMHSGTGAALEISGGDISTVMADAAFMLEATAGTGLVFDNADGSYSFAGAATLSGGAGIAIVNGSDGSFTFGDVGISGGGGILVDDLGASANVAFNGLTTVSDPADAGVTLSGMIDGSVAFDDLSLTLATDATTGVDLSGAVVNGSVNATGFTLTSTTDTGTVGIDLTDTTGTGSVHFGDTDVNGENATIAGVETGVLFSSATDLSFTFGDGEATTDVDSSISALRPIDDDGSGLPAGGSYNFLDVTLVGDTSNLSVGDIYYADVVAGGAGTAGDPGDLVGAEASSAEIIVLVNNGTVATPDVIDALVAGGSFDLDDDQQLVSFLNSDTLSVGGGAPSSFQLTGITTGVIDNPNPGSGAPELTTTAAGANVVNLADGNVIDGLVITASPGAGHGIAGTDIADATIVDSQVAATGSAIAITDNTANMSTVTISGVTATSATDDAVSIAATSAASDLRLRANNNVFSGDGFGLLVDGDVAGDQRITVEQLAGNTVNTSAGASAGMSFTGVVFDAVAGGGFDEVDGGTTTLGTTADRLSGDGLALANVEGHLSFASLDIANNGGTGLLVQNVKTNSFDLDTDDGTIDTINGTAVDLDPLAVDITLSSVAASGGTNGIRLDEVSGSFTVTGQTDISNTSGAGISITGATTALTADFNGTVDIDNTTTAGGGVDLVGNTAGTFNFDDGLVVATTSGAGFNATGGGTVTVTGTGSTITTTTGTAVNIADTTIGVAGVTLQSVSADGAVNGIVLDNTGAAGAFTVTGTGASTDMGTRGTVAASLGSGGTIQNTTGDAIVITDVGGGVSLSSMIIGDATAMAVQAKDQVNNIAGNGIAITNADDIVLENLKIARTGGHGITGTGVTNFSMANSEILNAGDANGDNGLNFADGANNLDGTAVIRDSILSASAASNAVFSNASGTLDLTVDNSHFTRTANTGAMMNGEDGLVLETRTGGSAPQITATVTGSQFDLLESDGIWAGANAGAITLTATGNSFAGFDAGASFSDNAISLNTTGDGSSLAARIEGNDFLNSYHSTIILNFNSELDGGGNPIPSVSTEADVIIANNTFTGSTLGAHIEGGADDNSTVRLRIENNVMTGHRLAGIHLSSNNISSLHATILDNDIGAATGDDGSPFQENLGVTINDVGAGAFLWIENNTVAASRDTAGFGQPEAIGIINSDSSANVQLERGSSASNDPATVILDNNPSPTPGDSNGTGVDIFGPVTVVDPGAVQQPTVP